MKLSKRALIMVCALVLATTATAFGTIAYLTDRAQATNTFTVGNVDIDLDEADVDENGNQKYPYDGNGDNKPDGYISVDENGNLLIDDNDPNTPPVVVKPNDDGTYPPTDVNGDSTPDTITVDPTTGVPTVNGTELKPGRDAGNEYNLVPGATYLKDPTMTVVAGSEKSYVRMLVEVYGYDTMATQLDCEPAQLMDELTNVADSTYWTLFGTPQVDGDKLVFEYRYKEPVDASTAAENMVLPALFTEFKVPGELTGDQLREIGNAGFMMDIFGHAIQTASFASETEAWAAFDDQNKTQQ